MACRDGPKRGRLGENEQHPPGPDDGDGKYVTQSDLDDMFETWGKQIASAVADANKSLEATLKSNMVDLVKNYDARANVRFTSIEAELAARKEKQEKQDAEQKAAWAAMEKMHVSLATAESLVPPKNVVADDEFNREIDLGVFRIGAASMVDKPSVREAIQPWLDTVGVPLEQLELIGPNMGKNYSLRFLGADGLAARRAKNTHTHTLLRAADGSWKEYHAVGPHDSRVRLYISQDKTPRQHRIEMAAKRLHRAVQQVVQGKTAHLLRRDGAVSIGWKPVAKIQVVSADETIVLWNEAVVQELRVDKAAILAIFNAESGSTAGITWG